MTYQNRDGSIDMGVKDVVTLELLDEFDVFNGLDDRQLQEVRSAVGRCYFAAGEDLIVEGETSRELYGVLEGRVEILRTDDSGHEQRLAVLRPDAILGEHGFVLNEPRTATVRALDEVDALCLKGGSFDELDALDHRIGRTIEHNILKMLAHRQTGINNELLEILDKNDDNEGYHCDETNDIGEQLMARWTV